MGCVELGGDGLFGTVRSDSRIVYVGLVSPTSVTTYKGGSD
jgi:hypothetical protein